MFSSANVRTFSKTCNIFRRKYRKIRSLFHYFEHKTRILTSKPRVLMLFNRALSLDFVTETPSICTFFPHGSAGGVFRSNHYIVHCFWNIRLPNSPPLRTQSADFLYFRCILHHKCLNLQRDKREHYRSYSINNLKIYRNDQRKGRCYCR